jgi:ABC-type nitrate/sulfonate/bicarbonate transport system substrate-binding protein
MKKLQVLGIVFVCFVLLPAAAFCGGTEEKTAAQSAAPAASGPTTFGLKPFPQKQTLRVGYFAGSPLSLPFYIADKEGFFKVGFGLRGNL